MTAHTTTKARKFRGFAVIDGKDGPLIWGTFRPKEADARAAHQRHNPAVDGHPQAARVVPVEIWIFDKDRAIPLDKDL